MSDPNDPNPVEDLETNYRYLGFHQSMIILPILTMYLQYFLKAVRRHRHNKNPKDKRVSTVNKTT
jgi:hypothetical protein